MVVWQDAGGTNTGKSAVCVGAIPATSSTALSVIFVRFFPVFAPFHDRSAAVEAACVCVTSCDFLQINSPLLKNLLQVSCASGNDLEQLLSQLCCSFAELVFHTIL